jgi:hypothetical protein
LSANQSDTLSVAEAYSALYSANKEDSIGLTEVSSSLVEKQLADSLGITETLTIAKRSLASSVLNAGTFNYAPINN